MEYENKTLEHKRSANGNVHYGNNAHERKPNGLARFLGGVATTMAIALALTGLMLYASVESNAHNRAHIAKLEESNRGITAQNQSAPQVPTQHNGEFDNDARYRGEETQIADITQSEKERAEQAQARLDRRQSHMEKHKTKFIRRHAEQKNQQNITANNVTANDTNAPVVDPAPAEPTITPEMEQLKTNPVPHGTEINDDKNNAKVVVHGCKNC